MTHRPPDFDELVGSDLGAAERERLRRVHELLVAAGPPPEISLQAPPTTEAPRPAPPRRRRRGALVALAATLGVVAAFTVGLVVADSDGPRAERVVGLSGAAGARASLEIYDLDPAGNWPMLLQVEGLPPAADGALFQLWLTRDGRPVALCGSFLTDAEGKAVVPMNAPWRLDDFDGWVVVANGSKTPLLTT